MSDSHAVSVVIPTIGRASLEECREGLRSQNRPPDEVIVVHDENRCGPSWARNEGIRRSHGDLVAFLDDDCVPPPEWLESMIGAMDRHEADGVGGTYKEVDPFLSAIRLRRKFPEIEQKDLTGFVGAGGNVIYKREWLESCEKRDGFVFDEAFRISQDIELAWRLRARGARLVFVPTNVAHLRRETFFSFLRFQFGRGAAIADLHRAQRVRNTGVPMQKSLLWEKTESGTRSRWIRAVWLKALGPFDFRSFNGAGEFVLFWLGEKVQGAGFIFGLLFQVARKGTPGGKGGVR